MSPDTVKLPPELKDIVSDAAADEAVLNDSLVALDEELKSPSDIAEILAATNIASVPVPSSGAWKLIVPKTSSCAMSVSPVSKVNIGEEPSVAERSFRKRFASEFNINLAPSVVEPTVADLATISSNEVALEEELKSPSDFARINADFNIASVPVPSSGA